MNSKTNGMKRNTINIRRRMGIMPFTAVALMVLVMLGSCELERSRNKKLDGYWREYDAGETHVLGHPTQVTRAEGYRRERG